VATTITFDSLTADLGRYLEKARRPDSEAYAQIPRVINLAERVMVDELKLQGYEATLRGAMQAGKAIYPKPDRWRETLSMFVEVDGEMRPVYPRGYEYARQYWPDVGETEVPLFYADHGVDHFLIVPTPAEAYPWELKAYLQERLLGPETQANWLTRANGPALQWQSLKQMAIFLKKIEEAKFFESQYAQTIGAKVAEDGKKLMDRAAERDGA